MEKHAITFIANTIILRTTKVRLPARTEAFSFATACSLFLELYTAAMQTVRAFSSKRKALARKVERSAFPVLNYECVELSSSPYNRE
jgi:hypothetical protein